MTEGEIKVASQYYTNDIFGFTAINNVRTMVEEAFIAGAFASAPKWIDVRDARPANPRMVIVVNAGIVRHGFYFDDKWYCGSVDQPLNNVTKYCEFPSPPNSKP